MNYIVIDTSTDEILSGYSGYLIDEIPTGIGQRIVNCQHELYFNNYRYFYNLGDIIEVKRDSPISQEPLTLEQVNRNVTETKDVAVNTEGTVMMTSEDALTIMELQLENQALLNQIITKLGI